MLSSGRLAQDYIFRFPVKSQKQLNGLVVYNVLKADMQTMFDNICKLPYTRAFFESYMQYSKRNCFHGSSLYQKVSQHCQTFVTCLRKREHNCRAAAGRATIHSVSRRDDGGRCGAAAQHSSRMHRSGHQRKYLNTGSGFLWRFNELADIPGLTWASSSSDTTSILQSYYRNGRG